MTRPRVCLRRSLPKFWDSSSTWKTWLALAAISASAPPRGGPPRPGSGAPSARGLGRAQGTPAQNSPLLPPPTNKTGAPRHFNDRLLALGPAPATTPPTHFGDGIKAEMVFAHFLTPGASI